MTKQKKNVANQQSTKSSFWFNMLTGSAALACCIILINTRRDHVGPAISGIDGVTMVNKARIITDTETGPINTDAYVYKAKGFWFETDVSHGNTNTKQYITTQIYVEDPAKLSEKVIALNAKIQGKTVDEFKKSMQNDETTRTLMDMTLSRSLDNAVILSLTSVFNNSIEDSLSPQFSPALNRLPAILPNSFSAEQKTNWVKMPGFLQEVHKKAADAKGFKPSLAGNPDEMIRASRFPVRGFNYATGFSG